MTAPWEESWDFYMSQMADDPLSVLVDLGAGPHVPLETHNVRVRTMVHMKNPSADGLRSREESEAIFALEDRLSDMLNERFDALMVGRVTVRGMSDVVFYAPGTMVGQIEALRETVDQVRGNYEIDLDVAPDVTWEFYREVLWPDTHEYQFMLNNRVLRQLGESGDDPSIPRPVDHLVILPNRDAAEKAATGLRQQGFEIPSVPEPSEDGTYRIEFQDETALDEGRIHQRVGEIIDVVLPLEGTYDGWGCPVMQPEPDNN